MWQIETTVSMSRFVQLPLHLLLVVLLLSLLCCCACCTGCNVCVGPACSPAKTLKRTGQDAEQHNQRPQNDRKWNRMHWYTKIFSHVQLTWTVCNLATNRSAYSTKWVSCCFQWMVNVLVLPTQFNTRSTFTHFYSTFICGCARWSSRLTIWLKDILSRRQFELGIDPKTTRTMISFGIKVFWYCGSFMF